MRARGSVMGDATPYTKEQQLGGDRPRKKYRRHVAGRKEWQQIAATKDGPCRACSDPAPVVLHLHHLVFRNHGGGDVPDNIVPLCSDCHADVHNRKPRVVRLMCENLTDAEYAYICTTAGEDYIERVYGLEFTP